MLMEVIHHIKLFNLILFNILVFEKISNTYKNGKIGLNVWNMTLRADPSHSVFGYISFKFEILR